MFDLEDVCFIANKLQLTFDKFTPQDLLTGINVELEHGKINPKTNVTNDDLEFTAKIALAHLSEFPNYYNKDYGIMMFEQFLKEKLKS
jgi:hypothetical protein